MQRIAIAIAGIAAAILAGGGIVAIRRLASAQENNQRAITQLKAQLVVAERQRQQPIERLADPDASSNETASIPTATAQPATTIDVPPATENLSDAMVLTNSLRDVVVTVDQCSVNVRTLRCSFTITNQSTTEKRFVLGVGGTWSRFENQHGGASFFDDLGNDFLSAGGSVGNHAQANCDAGTACEVEKTLTPVVRTPGWLRFDNIDPQATTVKLLRIKWSDGDNWVAMDFRNIAIARP